MVHQPVAYPGFRSMKRLGVFLLLPGRYASPSQGYPQHQIRRYPWVERGTARVECLAQEHNAMSPARARTRNARSGDERTNHEATAPSTFSVHTTQQSPLILDLCLRKTRAQSAKLHIIVTPFSNCFPSTRKRKAGVFIFFRFEERVLKPRFRDEFSSVDGRPNRKNEAAF